MTLYHKSTKFTNQSVLKSTFRYILLFPLSILYGLITSVRNTSYKYGLLKTYNPTIPTIVVGNLAVGGTGKTPHIEMLLTFFIKRYNTAVLSRGYKRKTKGFVLASSESNSLSIGDESYQLYRKFKNTTIAVDENRVHGIKALQNAKPNTELVLLDDAFQHRAINPGLKILLTDYSNTYYNDSMLPGGNLREYKKGAQRADIIIVTKCPRDITEFECNNITKKLALHSHQKLYFSTIIYDSIQPLFATNLQEKSIDKLWNLEILLTTGIVSHKPLATQLENSGAKVRTMAFPDHHQFSKLDYVSIMSNFNALASSSKIILVTEKDAARIIADHNYPEALKAVTYFIPITIAILQNKQSIFETQLLDYVETYKRNN